MKKPEEIKEALECHASDYAYNGCRICPYFDGEECESGLVLDAKAYIEQLEEQIQLMKIQMHGDCGVCKHRHNSHKCKDGPSFIGPCQMCVQDERRPNWEYEGLSEV